MHLFRKRLSLKNKLFSTYLPVAVVAIALAIVTLEITNTTNFLHDPSATTEEVLPGSPSNTDASDPAKAAKEPSTVLPPTKTSQPPQSISGSGDQKTKVTPEITYAGQSSNGQPVEIRAFVPQVYENGGTCQAIFTKNAETVSKSSVGFKNVSYTTCPSIAVPRSSFPSSGTWTLILSYKSATSEGSSQSQTVSVQ